MFNPTSDFSAVVDGHERITLKRRGTTVAAVEHAWRGPASEREAAASDGQVVSSDVRWRLPTAECPTPPALGDLIVDLAGNRWTVLAVAASAGLGQWACTCRNLAVAHGLNDVLTFQRAAYGKDSQGATTETWHTWRSGIRARLQPLADEVLAGSGTRATAHRVRIHLADDLEVDHACRILAADGTLYRILGSAGSEQIGGLQTLEAERIP